MSKLLKKTIKSHRPHIAARMTKENGYDETKHKHTSDLKDAGIINGDELADLDGCIEDLAKSGHHGAQALKAAKSGEINEGKLNSQAFIDSLDLGDEAEDDDDDMEDGDGDETADEKVTA